MEHIRPCHEFENPIDCTIHKFSNHTCILKINEVLNRKRRSFSFAETTIENINKAIQKLKKNKASVFNDLPCFILKDHVDLCGPYILDIINSGITCNSFPNDMKKADFTPVFKDSDRTLKSIYRPISLLPIVSCKTF